MPVVEKAEGECDRLRCRYHGWSYDTQGRFLDAPSMVAPADPSAGTNDLDPVGLAEAEGLLFTRLERGAGVPPSPGLDGRSFAEALTAELNANWKAAAETLLDAGSWRFEWPLAFVRDMGSARIVRQVVPRSFTRTRLIDLVFGAASAEAVRAAALADKAAAEARQALLAEDVAPPPSAAVAAFRARVAVVAPPA
jgi:hypothetical protein